MSYVADQNKYIAKHKKLIASLMNVPSHLSVDDLRIFANHLSYRAGEPHYQQNGGKIDSRFIDDIRLKSPSKRNYDSMLKAIAWHERGVLKKGSLVDIFRAKEKFSPKVEKDLEKKRVQYYREDFKKINKSVKKLRGTITDLRDLLSEQKSLHDKSYLRKIQRMLTTLRKDLDRCDYHSKAGIAWAVKIGVPFDHARKAVQEVYLKHLESLSRHLAPFEELMQTQGIDVNISSKIEERRSKWATDLILARFELQSERKAVTHEQKRVFKEPQGAFGL